MVDNVPLGIWVKLMFTRDRIFLGADPSVLNEIPWKRPQTLLPAPHYVADQSPLLDLFHLSEWLLVPRFLPKEKKSSNAIKYQQKYSLVFPGPLDSGGQDPPIVQRVAVCFPTLCQQVVLTECNCARKCVLKDSCCTPSQTRVNME